MHDRTFAIFRPTRCKGCVVPFAAFALLVALSGCGGTTTPQSTTSAPTQPTQPPANPQTLRGAAQSHGILMGAAADSGYFADATYGTTLSTEYSLLEPENEMKFGPIHPQPTTYSYAGPDQLVSFAVTNGMKVRGHNLVWDTQLPDWVATPNVPWTPSTLSTVLSTHIANVVGHYKGQIYAWDVVNEPFADDGTIRSTIWYDQPGIGFAGEGTKYIEQALVWAHSADPAALLFVNEYGAELMNAKSDGVYAMAKDFVSRGVPLGGIGFELHIDPTFDTTDNMNSLSQNIQRLGALGLQVHFTEIDVRLSDNTSASLAAQAKTYQDLMTVCIAQPSCKLFQTWGFTDKYSWIPSYYPGYGWALPFDATYAKKPAYTSLLKTLQ